MAISIYERSNFSETSIPLFTGGDSVQLDPCFAAFKRISWISSYYCITNFIANLYLVDKFSIRTDSFEIDKNTFLKMKEFYKDKDVNIIIESIKLYYRDNISDEDSEFLNKISPKMLTINSIKWSVENIKMLSLLNWTNIDAYFSRNEILDLDYWFIKNPIQLFDSQCCWMRTYKWKSLKFIFVKDLIKKIKLLKTNTENFLFIPLDTIARILCSGFSEISNAEDINKKFADFDHQFDIDGFVVPMEYFNKIFFELNNFNLEDLSQIKEL